MEDNNVISIVWIDDDFGDVDGDRKAVPSALEEQADHMIKVRPLEPVNVDAWISEIRTTPEKKPDILIIDLRLKSSLSGKKNTPAIYDSGYKVAGLLEYDEFAAIPKYLVSAALEKKHVGLQSDPFDWVLDHASLVQYGAILRSHGLSYRKIKKFASTISHRNYKDESSINAFATSLASEFVTPESDLESIVTFIIDAYDAALRQDNTARSLCKLPSDVDTIALHIARWIRGVLLKRNGVLVDDHMAANIFGVRPEYFNANLSRTIESEMPMAKYSGLFCEGEHRKWWRSELVNWGLDKCKDVTIGSVGRMAQQFAECFYVPGESQSECTVCKEKWPDAIAQDAEETEEVHLSPVHRGCSHPIKGVAIIPGFDELREYNQE